MRNQIYCDLIEIIVQKIFISLQKIPSKDHEAIHTDILKEKYRSKEDILKELYRPKEDLIKDNCGFCEK